MPAGRPTVLTPIVKRQLAECFWLAMTDEQAAIYTGIDRKTIFRARLGQFCPEIKRAEIRREMVYRRRIWNGDERWQGIAWFLERKYPQQFAKPEIQLSFQNNYTQNNLSISITSGEVKQIEAVAEPVRAKVKEMFAQYKPAQLGNGNGTDEH